MNSEEKQKAIVELRVKEASESVFTDSEWEEFVKRYSIKFDDCFTNQNKKYLVPLEITSDDSDKVETVTSHPVLTISNGNAFDCPSLKSGRCNIPCYGFGGCYTWDNTKVNKEWQRLVIKFATVNWIFEAIKYLATSKRKKAYNLVKAIRLNEVSDFTQSMLDKWIDIAKLLYSDDSTRHIIIFSYTKQNGLVDFSEIANMPNFVVNNSQVLNPVYSNGNCFIAVSDEVYDSIVETDTVKKCNCDEVCYLCGHCFEDKGLIIFCRFH